MTTPKTDKLAQRLAELNQNKIDLGLDRLNKVIQALNLTNNLPHIITVGGTNGKGSTVAALSSLLNSKKLSFGAFTSPHIFKFNERFNINGSHATDEEIINAFELIDKAISDINLSYFEYSFLTAVLLFKQHDVDFMLLEVGLGGRLDATNALDSDACIITTVDIDHTAWLGDTLELIAAEKAGIMRAGRPVIFGDYDVPKAIESHANKVNAQLLQLGQDYQITLQTSSFNYQFEHCVFNELKRPQLKGDWQIKNFSSAMTALISLGYQFDPQQIQSAINAWRIKGRLESIKTEPLVLVDVAHNRQSAQMLAQYLKSHPINGKTRAVFSVLADKQLDTWLGDFDDVIDHWFVFELAGERALDIFSLKSTLSDHVTLFSQFDSGKQAYEMALQCSASPDRIIVFGSFHVLDEVFSSELHQV